ncbi:uncharacterized protein LOC141612622 [Silene latifolia]|uniref:uncharacterized protein LOC141612622 n=1 Tax=Silene latifolia TaxID=37657 RepID=UPI003D78780B
MSSFLAPTPNNGIDWKLLRAVEDPEAIPHFDWCSYILDMTVKAGSDCKKGVTLLNGCIPFLMISYFQRYDYKGKPCKHDLPLIKHWDETALVERVKFEVGQGGLGTLTLSKTRYPRCLQDPSYGRSVDSSSLSGPREPKLLLLSGPPPPLSCPTSEKKFIQIELPAGVEDDQKLKARAVDGTHELYLQMQRNAIVFYSWYADATARIKAVTSDPTGLNPSQASQEFFEGEKMQKYVAEAEQIAERLKVSVGNAPAFGEVVTEPPKKI